MGVGCAVVLDVGKTVSKLSVWNDRGELLERHERRNPRISTELYLALDVTGIDQWLEDRLEQVANRHPVSAIVPTAHGAAAAIIRDAQLSCAPMDYEQPIPEATRARYDELRDPFAETGSPSLPGGLNLGAQLAWLEEIAPGALGGDAVILPWPQYWAWRLSSTAASEVTSLGCHSDLWKPFQRRASSLAQARGWAHKLAPLRRADEVVGTVHRDWAQRTGLSPDTKVLCGIHDSNAALHAARGFPEIEGQEVTVLSTGTWFVAMRSPRPGAAGTTLPENRDCLLNVDCRGDAIPSARFMGGREIELLTESNQRGIDHEDNQAVILGALQGVLAASVMIVPTLTAGVGPYPHARGGWQKVPADWASRLAAVCLYIALTADAALDLIGTRERIVIEGRFAQAELFVRALATVRPDCEVFVSYMADGVSLGALRLVNPALRPKVALRRVKPLELDITPYKAQWRESANAS